jgi:hypothetical protein
MKKHFLFKDLFYSYTFSAFPILLLIGVLALFGISPIYFNNEPYYGIKGLIAAIIMIPFIGIILATTNWLFLNFGYVIYSFFRSNIFRNK